MHSSKCLSQGWKDKLWSVFLGTWAASVLPNMRQVSEAYTGGIILHFLLVTLASLETLYSTQRNMGIDPGWFLERGTCGCTDPGGGWRPPEGLWAQRERSDLCSASSACPSPLCRGCPLLRGDSESHEKGEERGPSSSPRSPETQNFPLDPQTCPPEIGLQRDSGQAKAKVGVLCSLHHSPRPLAPLSTGLGRTLLMKVNTLSLWSLTLPSLPVTVLLMTALTRMGT